MQEAKDETWIILLVELHLRWDEIAVLMRSSTSSFMELFTKA